MKVPQLSQHAVDQAAARLPQLSVLMPDWPRRLLALAQRQPSVAVRMLRITRTGSRRGSNGDTVVAVIRDGNLITVMLRRATQSFTPVRFGVACTVDWTTEGLDHSRPAR